jgi:hypothetical protein
MCLLHTKNTGTPASIVRWYNQRGEASENRIKELKIGFNMEYMHQQNRIKKINSLRLPKMKTFDFVPRLGYDLSR